MSKKTLIIVAIAGLVAWWLYRQQQPAKAWIDRPNSLWS